MVYFNFKHPVFPYIIEQWLRQIEGRKDAIFDAPIEEARYNSSVDLTADFVGKNQSAPVKGLKDDQVRQ